MRIGELDLVEGVNGVALAMPERNPAAKNAGVAIIDVAGRLLAPAD